MKKILVIAMLVTAVILSTGISVPAEEPMYPFNTETSTSRWMKEFPNIQIMTLLECRGYSFGPYYHNDCRKVCRLIRVDSEKQTIETIETLDCDKLSEALIRLKLDEANK
jgi:hypothetical protein